ncbi:NADH-quinone oxidoreductase subunit E, partial [Mesorhizobium sp. M7D.F.Ca.US.004.03.1.1]
ARDREAREAAKAAKAAPDAIIAAPVPAPAAAPVAPSNASKPKTDAPETSPALKTPSKAKVAPAAEKAASVSAPLHSAANANKAAPEVEQVSKQRNGPKTKAEPAAAFKAPETKAPAAKAAKPSLEDKNRPAGIDKPALVDDLKLISGVGPKIEGVLHSLGIYTFAQVASWKKAEREWVDGYLSFHGRIDRDDWVKQAKALAKGGVAEYIRVFGKKPV